MSALAIPASAPSVMFYEPQRSQVYALVSEATELVDDVTALITSYAIQLDLFGSAEWKRYFNQDVGEEPTLPDAFWKFWHSPDAVNPAQKVWETHLPPVLRPEFVIDMDTKARRDFCLIVMGELIQQPKEGHRSQYYNAKSEALHQHGRTEAGPACWLIMRKDILSRDRSFASQVQSLEALKAGYEPGPSTIDLVTVVFTRFVVTQERYLGDNTGIEACLTYSKCQETFREETSRWVKTPPIVVGMHTLVVGGRGGLSVGSQIIGSFDAVGIAALRKFPAKEIK